LTITEKTLSVFIVYGKECFKVFLILSGILLGTTELGSNIWYLLPFVWPIKLIFAYTSHEVTSHVVLIFLALSVIITVVLIGVFNNWYNRWDGINKMEE